MTEAVMLTIGCCNCNTDLAAAAAETTVIADLWGSGDEGGHSCAD